MASKWQLLVEATGKSTEAKKAMRDLSKSSRKLQRELGVNFGAIAKRSAMAFGGGLAATLAVGFKKLSETQKQFAQTEAVIKSTGGAAGVTAKQVQDMADAMAGKTGVDDDAIQAGQNMLLTFTKIRNEVGKGNDIFNQSSEALIDMSVAMGTEPKMAAIQLGKALNDPVKGVTALGRAGVQFTEGQKDMIESLVASGNTMKAQKMILKELNTQFGGSAEAYGKTLPGMMSKAKQSFETMAEALARVLLPTVLDVTQGAQDLLVKIEAWAESKKGQQTLQQIAGYVDRLGDVILATAKIAVRFGKAMYEWRGVLIPVAAAIGTMVAVVKAARIATAAWAVVQATMNVLLTANPVGLVVVAIAGLVAGLVVAYKRSDKFRGAVQTLWGWIKKAASVVWNLKEYLLLLAGPGGALLLAYRKSEKFRGVVKSLASMIERVLQPVVDKVKGAFDGISSAIDAITGKVGELNNELGPAVKDLGKIAAQGANVGRRGRGAARGRRPGMGGIDVFGEIRGGKLFASDVLGYLERSQGTPYETDDEGNVIENREVTGFLKQRQAASRKRLNFYARQREKARQSLAKKLRAIKNARKQLGRAKRAKKKGRVKKWEKIVRKLSRRIGELQGLIDHYEQEMLALGGQIIADTEALEKPDPIVSDSGDEGAGSDGDGSIGSGVSGGDGGAGGVGGSSITPTTVTVRGGATDEAALMTGTYDRFVSRRGVSNTFIIRGEADPFIMARQVQQSLSAVGVA